MLSLTAKLNMLSSQVGYSEKALVVVVVVIAATIAIAIIIIVIVIVIFTVKIYLITRTCLLAITNTVDVMGFSRFST